jgi:ribosomal protein S12 methylthiotransferase accessory factor
LIPESKLRAIGVTRVARVTGLDRTGLEVACAVRPLGHVLQVSQGKGLDWAGAVASAVGEAAELHAAENPDPRSIIWGSATELGGEVWLPDEVSGATSPALAGPEVVQGWVAAASDRGPVYVPASAVYCPPGQVEWIGPATSVWTSNGLGAGPTLAHARRHGLFELLERAALNEVLPTGWSPRAARARLLEWKSPLLAALERRGFPTFVFDCTPRGWAMPIVAALLFDREGGPIPVTAGYACRAKPSEAATSAVLEAAQSRVTEIHGAREDVLLGRRQEGLELLEALRDAKPKKRLTALPSLHGPRVPLPRGMRTALVELDGGPLRVARVFARGVRHSELLE